MPFPLVIDSTMRSTFVGCSQRFKRGYVDCLTPPHPNINFKFGGAFARGLEVFRHWFYGTESSKDEALVTAIRAIYDDWGDFDEGEDERKSLPRCIMALVDYFDEYEPATDHIQPYMLEDGSPAVELSFSFPLNVMHPETDDPLLYAGRYDMLAEYSGQLYVVDEKTPKQLGESWARQWSLHSQFTGYCHSAKQWGMPVVGAIVRGVGILAKRTTFAEHITLRPQWMIDRWLEQLERDAARMVISYKEGYFDYNIDDDCSSFFTPCEFMPLCEARFPEKLLSQYKRRRWNPLLREEKEL